jgi:hypothetical protein
MGILNMKIFISYRRSDSKIFTGRILDRLTQAFGGRSIFRDIEDISAGKDFRQALKDAVDEADIMLVMIGPQWASITDTNGNKRLFDTQDFVRLEVETALKRTGMTVIPILLLNTPMPTPEELPVELRELLYRNAVGIRDDPDFSTDLQRLIDQIRRIRPIENVLRWATYVLPIALVLLIVAVFAIRGIASQSQPPTATPAQPTWTVPPTSTITNTPAPTDTVPAGDPTSTPEPHTPTPEPTFTAAPPAIGSDWANGCISVLWRPYPDTIQTTANNGCLSEPINLFFAADGGLKFLANGRFDNTEVYGLFAPLPASGIVSIDTLLRTLQEGEVWMGVFAEPDIESQGMVIVIPPGNVKQRPLVQKKMPGQSEIQQTAHFAKDPPLYNVVFEFGNGAVTTRILRDTVFSAVPVGAGQQWLFVGYQVKRGSNRIDAEFLNLVVTGQ